MKSSVFQHNIVGTAASMKRIMKSTKGCGQMQSNDTFFSDISYSIVKTEEGAMTEAINYCRPVNTSHKGFFLYTLG